MPETLSLRPAALVSEFSRRFTNWKLNRYFDKPTFSFIEYNRRKWPQRKTSSEGPVVLLGLSSIPASVFCHSYLANYLADKFGGRIESYQFTGSPDQVMKEVFASFGANFTLTMGDKAEYKDEAFAIFESLQSKWDVVNLTLDGILIGDKIYDTYLRAYNLATVDLKDERLAEIILQGVTVFHTIRKYLAKTKVAALLTDDPSYINTGILARMMFAANIPIYICSWGSQLMLWKVDPQTSNSGKKFPPPALVHPYYSYRTLFARLSSEKQAAAILRARDALEKRLAGVFCPLICLPQSPYSDDTHKGTVLTGTGKPKMLVMLHDFIDSPHTHRNMLFPDFYEWLCFLLEHAERTDFDWYVKPHPFASAGGGAINEANRGVVTELKKRFQKVTWLPPTASNQQIMADGVTALFTVHGTVAHEFAYRGVPVVNAGDSPHIDYDFNIHARTVEEYAAYIANADQLKLEIDREKIEEYFYMNYFYFTDHFSAEVNLIDPALFEDIESARGLSGSEMYSLYMAGATPERERGIHKYFDLYFNELQTKQSP
ncbi:MAG: hypothetical protein ABIP97_11000 [Chthoniobacterales bacterium]